ncbi:endonuclease/exonuclease/phosphatase family protein [Dyadobacter tibetensis]|uniref:endonuclease/exonuclease/phosphatase family protein n=1 Tax=Dyadobacter tibetensis TaxID=1211851 RepID=UPI00046E9479|nr:endonuclease/exonuclease/phosphatase family protein [Dyadobacter tibetensis]
MKKIRFWYVCLPIFLCLVTAVKGQPLSTERIQLKVLSYNIHHCNPPSKGALIDIEAIAEVIRKSGADLVALQEVDVNTIRSGKGNNQARLLAEKTGMNYYFSKAIDYEGGDYGVAILSRYSIQDSMRLDLPIHANLPEETRTLAAVTVSVAPGRQVIFASTHLGLKAANRRLQVENILSHFKPFDKEVILAADFNATPDSEEMKMLYPFFSPSCRENCDFTIPVQRPNRKIDYILHSPVNAFNILETYTIDEQYASDHLPVFTLFEMIGNL